MKRFLAFLTALVILSACMMLPVSAGDSQKTVGEVLYHQDFSVLSELTKSGIVRGTSSSENAHFTCDGDALELNTFDNERVYAILPQTETGDSYTIEFDFAFSEIKSENGYIGFILTCRGTEPTNITSLNIRAGGTIDDFETLGDALVKKISEGETIHVKIPIEKNVLHMIELTAGGTTYTIERDNVKVIDDGEMGFAVRNASVNVTEIYIVNGTGYTEKTGVYATESYASDDAGPVTTIEIVAAEETAPETGDTIVPYAAVITATAMGLFRRKRR